MNEQIRYVMAIYQLGTIIRDSMDYVMPAPKDGFSLEVYNARKNAIIHLVEENSPFAAFCKNNTNPSKEDSSISIGDKISNQIHEFIDDVYGDDSRIVKVDHDKVIVETSLLLQLLDYIIGLHETISDICIGFKDSFVKGNVSDPDFENLLVVDDPFYRARAFRCVAGVFNLKFGEYNQAVRSYIASERENTGVDPSTKPGFDPKVDPSCAFINNEMARIMGFFSFLRAHNKCKDVLFNEKIQKMADGFHYFDGSKKLAEGQKMGDVMRDFETIFNDSIKDYADAWVRVYQKIFTALVAYEKDLRAKFEAKKAAETAENKEAVEEKKENN